METEFTPIFLFVLVGIMTAVGMLVASAVLGPKRVTAVKQMPYESGMDPIGDARQRFDVRYYLVAIVFLLFDVELLFLYPWAVAQWSRSVPASSPPLAAPAAAAAEADANAATAPAAPVPALAVAGIPEEFRGLVFWEILVFIAILAAAFAYAWRKGVFEWR
jgi:NADH-quinone oxidoreductase subunit A